MESKNVLIYANCQGLAIQYGLETLYPNNRYSVVHNYECVWGRRDVPFELFQQCDVLIYQPTSAKHGNASTSYLIDNHLRKHVLKVSVPFVRFRAYFPTHSWIDDKYVCGVIDGMLRAGAREPDIVRRLAADDLVARGVIEETAAEAIAKLHEIDKSTDVKVADYIEQRYRAQRLFYVGTHPTGLVMTYVLGQIVKLLGLQPPEPLPFVDFWSNFQAPVYRSVRDSLGLQFEDRIVIDGRDRTLEQYVAYHAARF